MITEGSIGGGKREKEDGRGTVEEKDAREKRGRYDQEEENKMLGKKRREG